MVFESRFQHNHSHAASERKNFWHCCLGTPEKFFYNKRTLKNFPPTALTGSAANKNVKNIIYLFAFIRIAFIRIIYSQVSNSLRMRKKFLILENLYGTVYVGQFKISVGHL